MCQLYSGVVEALGYQAGDAQHHDMSYTGFGHTQVSKLYGVHGNESGRLYATRE